jgi:hypothetical protein
MDNWDVLGSAFSEIDPDRVTSLACGEREWRGKCHATTPCTQHERVVLHFSIDGHEYPRMYLSKLAWRQLTDLYRNRRELIPVLASLVTLSNQPREVRR